MAFLCVCVWIYATSKCEDKRKGGVGVRMEVVEM